MASSATGTTSTEDDQDAGWEFILEHGERDRSQLKQLRWIHRHINKDGCPIRGWSEKLVQRALDSLANDNCLALARRALHPQERSGSPGLRKDQTKWKCTLSDLLNADNNGIVKLLVRDKLLIDMTSVTCPRCGKGTFSKLTKCQGDRWKHKCSSRNCRVWLNPHHLHPVFADGWGNSAKSLQTQSTLLLLLLHRIPQSKIHMLIDINHKAAQGCPGHPGLHGQHLAFIPGLTHVTCPTARPGPFPTLRYAASLLL